MNPRISVAAVVSVRNVNGSGGVRNFESTSIGREVTVLYPASFIPAPERYVVLIHGYNTSYSQARVSYACFRGWLEERNADARVIEFHWPGNESWGLLSPACYSGKVQTARDAGVLLAQWMRTTPKGTRFVLLSHSLGGRVLLEAIHNLELSGDATRVESAALMAAAVPVELVARGARGPRDAYEGRWRVLFSPGDQVLRNVFSLGQLLTLNDTESSDEAVGLNGNPHFRWPERSEMVSCAANRSKRHHYDHGWYWCGGPNAPKFASILTLDALPLKPLEKRDDNNGESATAVAEFLGNSVPRALPIRSLPKEPALYRRPLSIISRQIQCVTSL